MSLRNRYYQAFGITLALGAWACGSDTTGPSNGNFDAEATAAGLAVVDGAFETAAFASLEALGGQFQIPGASSPAATELLRAAAHPNATDFSTRMSEAASELMASSAAPAVILIPEEYRGLTLTYHAEEGYLVDEARDDGPTLGVRFVLYAVNPITHEITEPLTEIGYADIIDASTETEAAIGLVVVSGEVTYLDYLITLSGTFVNPTFTIAGFITDGENQADFTLTHAYAVNIAGITINIDYEIDVNDFGMEVALGMVGGGEQEPTVTVHISLLDGANTVLITGSIQDGAGTLEVHALNVHFADITIAPGSVSVTNAEGEPLSNQEIQAIKELIEVIEGAQDIFEDLLEPVQFLFDN